MPRRVCTPSLPPSLSPPLSAQRDTSIPYHIIRLSHTVARKRFRTRTSTRRYYGLRVYVVDSRMSPDVFDRLRFARVRIKLPLLNFLESLLFVNTIDMIETVCNVCFILGRSKYIAGKLYREFKLILTHLIQKKLEFLFSFALFFSLLSRFFVRLFLFDVACTYEGRGAFT